RAQGLGASLLGGEALGIAGRLVDLPFGAGAFAVGEHPGGQAPAEAREGLLDAAEGRQVRGDADDPATGRRARSNGRRMRRVDAGRPAKIASPTRKWPMLSSTTSGMAAIGGAVS